MDVSFARSQMAMSLAVSHRLRGGGIGMPMLMAVAEGLHLRTWRKALSISARRLGPRHGVLFAVRRRLRQPCFSVSSFGSCGRGSMALRGWDHRDEPVFLARGFRPFFTEAIFPRIYLYGWDRISLRHALDRRDHRRAERPAVRDASSSPSTPG